MFGLLCFVLAVLASPFKSKIRLEAENAATAISAARLPKTLPRVAAEMALHVLAYNLTRVMNIMGTKPLMAAMRA
jgi:hypothetical protein